jgi:hypothetical protein
MHCRCSKTSSARPPRPRQRGCHAHDGCRRTTRMRPPCAHQRQMRCPGPPQPAGKPQVRSGGAGGARTHDPGIMRRLISDQDELPSKHRLTCAFTVASCWLVMAKNGPLVGVVWARCGRGEGSCRYSYGVAVPGQNGHVACRQGLDEAARPAAWRAHRRAWAQAATSALPGDSWAPGARHFAYGASRRCLRLSPSYVDTLPYLVAEVDPRAPGAHDA